MLPSGFSELPNGGDDKGMILACPMPVDEATDSRGFPSELVVTVVTAWGEHLEIGVCVEKSGCDPPENGQHRKS